MRRERLLKRTAFIVRKTLENYEWDVVRLLLLCLQKSDQVQFRVYEAEPDFVLNYLFGAGWLNDIITVVLVSGGANAFSLCAKRKEFFTNMQKTYEKAVNALD